MPLFNSDNLNISKFDSGISHFAFIPQTLKKPSNSSKPPIIKLELKRRYSQLFPSTTSKKNTWIIDHPKIPENP